MYQVKLIILGLLLVCISPATAWLDGWDYRREIQINNPGGSELTYYQVYVNLTDNPINSTSLRVVNESSDSIVPHWQETISSRNCTEIWFNATSIPVSAWLNGTYYIYYNNMAASITSSIKNTFVVGDDFKDSSVDTNLWVAMGAVSESTNGMTISSNAARNINYVAGVRTFSRDQAYMSEMTYQQSNPAPSDFIGGFGTSGVYDNGLWLYATDGTTVYRHLDGGYSSSWTSSSRSANTDWKIKVLLKETQGYTLWDMYNLDSDYTPREDNAAWTTDNVVVQLGNAYTNSNILIKQYTLRKYTENGLTTTLGIEEMSSKIPPNPTSLDHSKGFFWVNHTWQAGTGNVTDSYNVSHNNIWYNGTTDLYYNSGDIGEDAWSNITIYAYNNTTVGTLSDGYVSQNIQVPPYTPPDTPINLIYTKGEYWVNHTWEKGNTSFTGTYNVSHNGSWTNGSSNTYFNSGGVGRNGISTIIVYAYNGILSEEYIIQTISTKPGIGYDQKISDSNIQSFFFPIMFFLLIMILVGGFKYVYK